MSLISVCVCACVFLKVVEPSRIKLGQRGLIMADRAGSFLGAAGAGADAQGPVAVELPRPPCLTGTCFLTPSHPCLAGVRGEGRRKRERTGPDTPEAVCSHGAAKMGGRLGEPAFFGGEGVQNACTSSSRPSALDWAPAAPAPAAGGGGGVPTPG